MTYNLSMLNTTQRERLYNRLYRRMLQGMGIGRYPTFDFDWTTLHATTPALFHAMQQVRSTINQPGE